MSLTDNKVENMWISRQRDIDAVECHEAKC